MLKDQWFHIAIRYGFLQFQVVAEHPKLQSQFPFFVLRGSIYRLLLKSISLHFRESSSEITYEDCKMVMFLGCENYVIYSRILAAEVEQPAQLSRQSVSLLSQLMVEGWSPFAGALKKQYEHLNHTKIYVFNTTFKEWNNTSLFMEGLVIVAMEIYLQIYVSFGLQINLRLMQEQTSLTICNSRLEKYRKSAKFLQIVSQKSRDLQLKCDNLFKQQNRKETQNSLSHEDTSSSQSYRTFTSETLEATQGYNTFLQNYQLLEKLGQGSNASVFKCRYKPTDRFYAAKKFRIEKQHIRELKKNFIHLKELNHKSICRYKALYFDKNQRFAFLVMEYLPFPNLEEYKIKSQEQLKIIVRQIIFAISYIHNRNFCHRDIKPDNILYDQKTKKIKLIDFGISKKTYSRATRRDMLTIIGTPLYLAPEVYNGGGYDQRVDIWALGITIYKLITGYTPFQSEYHSNSIANILKGDVNFDEQIWKKYSPFAQYFVSQLLKSQDERITLGQASNHLWFQSKDSKQKRIRRIKSHNISLFQDFHHQLHNNLKNATSKEQGAFVLSPENQEHRDERHRLNKTINLMDGKQYDLQDSDDEDSVVTPKHAKLTASFQLHSLFIRQEIEADTNI